MNSGAAGPLLARVRKLLAKAEDVGVTPAEAQALTAKAGALSGTAQVQLQTGGVAGASIRAYGSIDRILRFPGRSRGTPWAPSPCTAR